VSEAPCEPLPEGLTADLSAAEAHAGEEPEVVQTHLSWVFLTRDRVVKVRKAVRLSFVDFGTRALRNADCLREVRLNRRLAPDVYLGVAPLVRGGSGWRVGPLGEALAGPPAEAPEHAVVMRRLRAGCDALSLLEAGVLTPAHLDAVAGVLAAFHARAGLGSPAPFEPDAWRDALARPMAENLASLRETLAGEALASVERTGRLFAARLARCAERLEARRREGRAVDGHGDVHLQHVWFEAGPEAPVLVDCIEFSEGLRRIDTASEVAFLAMDLRYRGRRELAERFLRRYAEHSDDFGLYGLVDLYAGYRAAVRAKVAGLAAQDAAIGGAQRGAAQASAARHLALAEALLADPRPGPLVLLCGTVGSGKSSVAQQLADRVGGAVVTSDRVRKRLAGLAPEIRATAGTGQGIYTAAWNEKTYAALLERAEPVLSSGRPALLDATYSAAAERRRAFARAAELGAPVWLVEVRCSEAVARERLARRAREGRDPSDAGPERLASSLARFEPPDEWPAQRRRLVHSDGPHFGDELSAAARSIGEIGDAGH
jgi:aminoglycoside phosphotransferase family enzyme/predicted kinase